FHSFNGYATEAEGLPLQRLQQAFSGLNQYLDTLAESDNLRQVAFDVSRDSQGGGAAVREIRSALSAAPPAIRKWFHSVAVDTERVTRTGVQQHANDVWHAEVVPFFDKAIKGRYPVDPSATAEIRLDDFARFFGPEGVLDNYFKRYIKPFA